MTAPTSAPAVGEDRRVLAVVSDIARGGIAGAFSGLVVGGIGGRLAMRLSAVVASDATGRLTENGNRVGEITVPGTIALLIFGGLLSGLLAGVVWVLAYPWMKDISHRWAVAGVLAVALGGPLLISAGNSDFFILQPAWFHVSLFVLLLFVLGMAVSLTDHWLERSLPRGDSNVIGPLVVYTLIAGAGAPAILLLFGSYFAKSVCGCAAPARPVGLFLIGVGFATAYAWIARMRAKEPTTRVGTAGAWLLVAASVAGLIHTAGAIALIL